MTQQAKKLNAVIFQLHNELNVYYENLNSIHQRITRRVDGTRMEDHLQRLQKRYRNLTKNIIKPS